MTDRIAEIAERCEKRLEPPLDRMRAVNVGIIEAALREAVKEERKALREKIMDELRKFRGEDDEHAAEALEFLGWLDARDAEEGQ